MISAADVFRVFQTHRGNAVVIATGTSGRHWRDFTTNEKRDLTMGGAMGQTTAAALGVALALPNEKVVLFDAEGALMRVARAIHAPDASRMRPASPWPAA